MSDNAKDTKSDEKNIVFFFGAGCEGPGQFELPSGTEFKKMTIQAKGAKKMYEFLNCNKDFLPEEGCLLHYNASSILYQTLIEDSEFKLNYDEFSEENKGKQDSVEIYLNYKRNKEKNAKDEQDCKGGINEYDDIRKCQKDFRAIYRNEFYDVINSDEEIDPKSNCGEFLKRACFYAYVDSLFNYLRKPELYPKEIQKVIKFYYAAFFSIIKKMLEECGNKKIEDFLENRNVLANREMLKVSLQELQEQLVEKHQSKSYYQKIYDLKNDKVKISVITTNYTSLAKTIIGLSDKDIAYLHGRLDWFEDLETKSIRQIDEHNENAVIIPFIFAQSAVKPIVSPIQINEYAKAIKRLETANEVIVLGYNFNSDDEHVVNIFREYKDKNITYFYHEDEQNTKESYEKNIQRLFGKDNRIKMINDKFFADKIEKIINKKT